MDKNIANNIYEQFKSIKAHNHEGIGQPDTHNRLKHEDMKRSGKSARNKVRSCSGSTAQLDGNISEIGVKE